jgi:hypothetical protein
MAEMTISDDMTDAELRRRYDELAKEFLEQHPAKWNANKFVDGLFSAAREPADSTRADRERARSAAELHVRYAIFCGVFEDVPPDVEEFLFNLLLKIMRSTYELGIAAAPEGRSAHEARKGSGDHMFAQLTATVGIYLDAHPELMPPKAIPDYANAIRPDILEVLGLSKDAKRPSVSAITRALRAVKRGTLKL